EFIVIGALALIFIGPKQLPEVARMVGRLLNELKRAGDEVFGSLKDVQNNTRKFTEDLEKEIEKTYKPPEPVIHKGVYATEEPERQTEMNLAPAPVTEKVSETKLETENKSEADVPKTGTGDHKRDS
ncbi:MAG: twin-arginine translocase TatA/TatE family subunit, partial [Bdellovibrionia bacterium]